MSSSVDNPTSATHGERQHYGVTFAVLAVGCSAYAMLQATVAPALPVIQEDLHASATSVAWVFTGYLLSASVLTPIVGRLGDMFGKEKTLLISLSVLSIGVLIAALANSIGLLIFGRIVQGSGGAIFPLSFGIIRDEFPRQKAAAGIAMISAILGIGGGVGIVLAGPIISALGYHWLFWIPLIVTVAATVATYLFVPESPLRSPGRVDWLGALLLSSWLVLLLLGITQTSEWGWGDARVWALIVAAAVMCAVWVRTEARTKAPLIDMAMMRVRRVWTVNAAAFLVGAGLYSSFILIPEFAEAPRSAGYGFAASVTQAGLLMLPMTIAMLVSSPIAGMLANRFGARPVLLAGCLVAAASFVMMALANSHTLELYVATALMGFGTGFAYSTLAILIVEAVPPSQTGVASGMNTVMRTLGGAVGAQIGASVIAGTVVASGLPTEAGFRMAFLLAVAACLLASLASIAVPRRRRPGAADTGSGPGDRSVAFERLST